MTLEDLDYFFAHQIEQGITKLKFAVLEEIDGKVCITELVHDTELYPLDDLIVLLDNCLYAGQKAGVPRFNK